MGDGWSIAWRVLDAQFWGVPQRRRRIALVADFGGFTAPPILFERDSVQGDIEQSGETGQGAAADTETGAYTAITNRGKVEGNKTETLRAQSHGALPMVCYGISAYESNSMKSGNPHSGIYEAETARTLDGNGGSPACNQGGMAVVQSMGFRWRNGAKSGSVGCAKEQAPTLGTDGNAAVYDARGNGDGDTAPTLTGDHQNRVTDYTAIISIDRAAYNQGVNAKYNIGINDDGKAQTLTAKGPNAVYTASHGGFMTDVSTNVANTLQATDYKDPAFVCPSQSIVRRLTPLECERLQGYPDHWTDIGEWTDSKGKKHKAADSPRYKALGNSIALPPWVYVLTKLNAYCKEHTMVSLFDGIGGFPLIWEYLNGKGSAVWCSEIEEFPIAVTKRRFSEI
jgi:DNA (cytosine-5)-methyltransferase 1